MKAAFAKFAFLPLAIFLVTFLNISSTRAAAYGIVDDKYDGRSMLVYVPKQPPPEGTRAMIVVLHGATGNAAHMEHFLEGRDKGMDALAEQYGFFVIYLNGTLLSKQMDADSLGWNAGHCCGMPSDDGVDDVGYIKGAVNYLVKKYGINSKRVYGLGYSNGAMMAQRMMCETSIFAAIMPVAGPLEIDTDHCAPASGKHILAIHGADDTTVPIAGGYGARTGAAVDHPSETETRKIFVNSGATYDLHIVPNAGHMLPEIEASVERADHQTLAEKAARFFGLVK